LYSGNFYLHTTIKVDQHEKGRVNSHLEKSLFWKVAVLMGSIVSAHPFIDGNKRTGFEVLKLRREYRETLEKNVEKRKDLLKRLAKL